MGNNDRRIRRQSEKWRNKTHIKVGVEVWCWRNKRGPTRGKLREWWKATILFRTGQIVHVSIPDGWTAHSQSILRRGTERISISQCDIHRPKSAKTGHKHRSGGKR